MLKVKDNPAAANGWAVSAEARIPLAQNADLYLLDEPFAGVDAATERAIIDVLKLLKSQGKSVIAVHHDLSTVSDYFDYIFMINVQGIAQGKIEDTFIQTVSLESLL